MDHYHDMTDYKCPRCLHTFRLSNKPLHDLRCSTEFPLKLDAESYNEILNNPGLYQNSNYARSQTVPNASYSNISTKVFQVNNFDQNYNQQNYNNNNYNYNNGYTIPTNNYNNDYLTQNYNTQQNYNYNYNSPSVDYTNNVTNSNYDNLFSGSTISYNKNTNNSYIYDVNTFNNNTYTNDQMYDSSNNYIFDTTPVTRYSNTFTSSDFYVDNSADNSSYLRNTLRESNIHEMGEYTDYDGRFKSYGGKVRGIVTLDDYKIAPEYNIYYGIEYDL